MHKTSMESLQKRLLSRPEHRWNIKICAYIKEHECEKLGWIQRIIISFENDNIKVDMKEINYKLWPVAHTGFQEGNFPFPCNESV